MFGYHIKANPLVIYLHYTTWLLINSLLSLLVETNIKGSSMFLKISIYEMQPCYLIDWNKKYAVFKDRCKSYNLECRCYNRYYLKIPTRKFFSLYSAVELNIEEEKNSDSNYHIYAKPRGSLCSEELNYLPLFYLNLCAKQIFTYLASVKMDFPGEQSEGLFP